MRIKAPYTTFRIDQNRLFAAIVDLHKASQEAKATDKDLAQSYARDSKDLTKVFTAINDGQFKKAFAIAQELDTIVRDQIPKRLYYFIAKAAGYC